jgi:hypothetical protein
MSHFETRIPRASIFRSGEHYGVRRAGSADSNARSLLWNTCKQMKGRAHTTITVCELTGVDTNETRMPSAIGVAVRQHGTEIAIRCARSTLRILRDAIEFSASRPSNEGHPKATFAGPSERAAQLFGCPGGKDRGRDAVAPPQ